MFHEMRRVNKKMEDNEAFELLKNCEYGILSTIGEDGYPYGVPVNYVCSENEILFHCAVEGHKIDNINYSDKVSFCTVDDTKVVPENFTSKYKSVIAFGKILELQGEEKKAALVKILEKYSPEYMDKGREYIQRAFDKLMVYKITIEYITGKKSV